MSDHTGLTQGRRYMKSIFLLVIFIILSINAVAQDPIGDSIDCTDIRIDFIDDPNLTKEERLRLMDKALMESINQYEHCQKQKAMKAGTDANTSENSGSGIQGTEGDGNIEQDTSGESDEAGGLPSSGMESSASSSMSGTEPDTYDTQAPADVATEDSQAEESVGTAKATGAENYKSEVEGGSNDGVKSNSGAGLKNGQIPDDIPDAKNDDALAAQIRYAAENEKDPEKREQLWNEYRKYKGLPKK